MNSHAFCFALLSATAVVVSVPAQAQNGTLTRSFVSSTGVDTNPCTITQPCATFAHAYTAIGANGIVAALDPGKYGPLTITGPVTINGNGWAAITGTSGGDAIDINIATGNVTLTGLELDGGGAGARGIRVASNLTGSPSLTIRDCTISNFTDSGIALTPTSSNGTSLYLLIANTYSFNNAIDGIKIAPGTGASVFGVISGSTVANNSNNGLEIDGNSGITLATSVVASNGNFGIYENNGTSNLLARDTIATQNQFYDFVVAAGNAYLYHNLFASYNATGGGQLVSDGTNQISGVASGNLPTKQSTF